MWRCQRQLNLMSGSTMEKHHSVKTFREEYLGMLKKFEIEYKDEYVFEFYED